MKVAQRLERLFKAYSKHWSDSIRNLSDTELMYEMLLELQRNWGEIHQAHVEEMIAAGGGRIEEWQEVVESVIEERCLSLSANRWALKAEWRRGI
jgi:hypothetical protein